MLSLHSEPTKSQRSFFPPFFSSFCSTHDELLTWLLLSALFAFRKETWKVTKSPSATEVKQVGWSHMEKSHQLLRYFWYNQMQTKWRKHFCIFQQKRFLRYEQMQHSKMTSKESSRSPQGKDSMLGGNGLNFGEQRSRGLSVFSTMRWAKFAQ